MSTNRAQNPLPYLLVRFTSPKGNFDLDTRTRLLSMLPSETTLRSPFASRVTISDNRARAFAQLQFSVPRLPLRHVVPIQGQEGPVCMLDSSLCHYIESHCVLPTSASLFCVYRRPFPKYLSVGSSSRSRDCLYNLRHCNKSKNASIN